ncbi:unnamed protein product [Symbiodinium microadriaticum]|nr:unnamed protein product [Symbiodinium microadriaticum]
MDWARCLFTARHVQLWTDSVARRRGCFDDSSAIESAFALKYRASDTSGSPSSPIPVCARLMEKLTSVTGDFLRALAERAWAKGVDSGFQLSAPDCFLGDKSVGRYPRVSAMPVASTRMPVLALAMPDASQIPAAHIRSGVADVSRLNGARAVMGQALDKPFTSPCDFAKLRSEDSCLMLEDCRFAASTLGPSFERLQRLWREQQVATGSGVPAHSITPTFVPSTTSAATTSFRKETRDATFGGGDLSPAPMGRRGTGSVKEAPLTKYNECWWGNEQRQMMANVSRLSRRIFKSWEYARGRGGSWGGSCG